MSGACKFACRTCVLSAAPPSLALVKSARRKPLAQRVLGAVDLAIDVATLGEYGLEPWPADEPCRERLGRKAGWEALPAARPRGACGRPAAGIRPRPAGGPASLGARRRTREAA